MNKFNLKIGVNNGFLAPVVALDFEDEKIKEIGGLIMQGGGFCVTFWGDEHQNELAKAKAVFEGSENEATKTVTEVIKIGQPVIMVVKQVYDNMEAVEALAMLYHEEGHIFHRDFDTRPENGEIYLLQDEMEIRADAYSATKLNKTIMTKALKSNIKCMIEVLRATKTWPEEKANEAEIKVAEMMASDPHFLKRFAALA